MFSYDGRHFRPEGETGPVLTYRQDGNLLWAEIPAGTASGHLRVNNSSDPNFCYVQTQKTFHPA